MSFSFARITSGVALLALFAANADAQPAATRGRSADGRAYRIENGMKLTDYIAELEVSNDDLHRQLDALEQELSDRDAKSPRGGKSGEHAPQFEEHNLIPQNARENRPTLPPAAQPTQAANAAMSCNTMVQSLNSKIASLEEQLRKTPATPPPAPAQAKCDYNSPENPYLARAKQLEASLTQHASNNEVMQSEHNRRLASEQELAKVKNDLNAQAEQSRDATERANKVAEKAAALEQQLIEAKDAADRAAAERAAAQPVRAALAPPPPARAEPKEQTDEKPTVDAGAVAAARTEFKNDLQQIQAAIIERKNLLDAVKGKGKGISISIQPLVTRSGTSLDSLRLEIQKLDQGSNIASIRKGLDDIIALLNDDVQTLKRMSK